MQTQTLVGVAIYVWVTLKTKSQSQLVKSVLRTSHRWLFSWLRLPYRNDAEIAKFCNLWTFLPVIQSIRDLFEIAISASFLYGNLKHTYKSMSTEFFKSFLSKGGRGSWTRKSNISLFFRHTTLCAIPNKFSQLRLAFCFY